MPGNLRGCPAAGVCGAWSRGRGRRPAIRCSGRQRPGHGRGTGEPLRTNQGEADRRAPGTGRAPASAGQGARGRRARATGGDQLQDAGTGDQGQRAQTRRSHRRGQARRPDGWGSAGPGSRPADIGACFEVWAPSDISHWHDGALGRGGVLENLRMEMGMNRRQPRHSARGTTPPCVPHESGNQTEIGSMRTSPTPPNSHSESRQLLAFVGGSFCGGIADTLTEGVLGWIGSWDWAALPGLLAVWSADFLPF